MSVVIRKYRRGGWECDIRLHVPGKPSIRVRRRAPVTGRESAKRWAEAVERELLNQALSPAPTAHKEVPTFSEFCPRFRAGFIHANGFKPSGMASKETILRVHLLPRMGGMRLDEVGTETVQQLKAGLRDYAPKTVNNVLTVLNVVLKTAVEWGVIAKMPGSIRLLPVPRTDAAFHNFDDYERLLKAAQTIDSRTYLIVLLGGEAGLRVGEIVALEWVDIDLERRQIRVQHSDWKGELTAPKNGRIRFVQMTDRLASAMHQHRHLRSSRVLCKDDGTPLTRQGAWSRVRYAAKRAKLPTGVHILRHTFCSHLTMQGAAMRAVQDLVGHQSLAMTQRYSHLSPAHLDATIRLLENRTTLRAVGDSLETPKREVVKSVIRTR